MRKGYKVVWREDNIYSPYFKTGVIYTVEDSITFGSASERLHIEGVEIPSIFRDLGTFASRFRMASNEELEKLPSYSA